MRIAADSMSVRPTPANQRVSERCNSEDLREKCAGHIVDAKGAPVHVSEVGNNRLLMISTLSSEGRS
jgi:hypothetical protein